MPLTPCRPFARWRLAWGAVLLACALLGSAAWAAQGPQAAPPKPSSPAKPPVTQLCSAWFAEDAQGPWYLVKLPDAWSQRGVDDRAVGHYRLHFQLDQAPPQVWALRLAQPSPEHEIRVNGHLVRGDINRPSADQAAAGLQLTAIPPALLQPGDNQVSIVMRHSSRNGLSCVAVGPETALRATQGDTGYWRTTLPLLLNAAALGFAVFIGLVWLRHREPFIPGTVPLLWAVASLRHVVRLSTESQVSGLWINLGYFINSVLASTLAVHLALTLGRRDNRRTLQGLYAVAALLMIGGTVATVDGQLSGLRSLTTPLLLLLQTAALLAAARVLRHDHDRTRRALFVGLALLTAALLFDYIFWIGLLLINAPIAMPYMVPLTMGLMAWALLHRVVNTLAHVRSTKSILARRVEERTRDLRQANAAKSRFLAAASHDLRQPVVSIGLLVDLLREQSSDPVQRDMILRVDEAVASMESFLAGLLDLSRFEAGTVTPRRQRVALQSLFDAVATHAVEAARLNGLRLRFRPTRLAVQSDPLLLEQILRNLVSNALRYTHQGGVLVAARARGNQVWLQVWDTGVGIAPEHHAAVFEELVQLDNPGRDSARGFGLGLAIVQRAAKVLDHRLALRSVPNQGSCFQVVLPRATAWMPPPASTTPQAQPLAGLRLAVLDDDPSVLQALGERLRHWGARVQGYASLGSLCEAHPLQQADGIIDGPAGLDLLVTDQRLPDGNGLQAIDWMRRWQAGLPALVITGNTEAAELATLHRSGVPVLHKPFRAEALLKAIQQVLRPLPRA